MAFSKRNSCSGALFKCLVMTKSDLQPSRSRSLSRSRLGAISLRRAPAINYLRVKVSVGSGEGIVVLEIKVHHRRTSAVLISSEDDGGRETQLYSRCVGEMGARERGQVTRRRMAGVQTMGKIHAAFVTKRTAITAAAGLFFATLRHFWLDLCLGKGLELLRIDRDLNFR